MQISDTQVSISKAHTKHFSLFLSTSFSASFLKIRMSSLQSWISDHKLTTIGTIWASAIGASLLYSRKRSPFKPSLRLIHARMHAQALTLAVLSGAATLHYMDLNNVLADDGTAIDGHEQFDVISNW